MEQAILNEKTKKMNYNKNYQGNFCNILAIECCNFMDSMVLYSCTHIGFIIYKGGIWEFLVKAKLMDNHIYIKGILNMM